MRQYRLAAAAALLYLPVASANGFFDLKERSPYGTLFGIYEIGESARDSSYGRGFQVTFGITLPDFENLDLEVSYSDVERRRDIDRRKDFTETFSVDLVRRFGTFAFPGADGNPRAPFFRPFVLGGAVLAEEDVRGRKNFHPALNVGGGTLIDLGYRGLALRTEARLLAQNNSKSIEGRSSIFDYRFLVGLQVPFSAFLSQTEAAPPPPPADCPLAVVDPVTGRVDCDPDSDGDGVPDRLDQCPGTLPGTVVDARGCPMIPSAQVIRGVNFETGSAVLLPESKRILDGTAEAIKSMTDPNLLIEIAGHTDSVGSAAYNLMLSQQRAEAVRQYLISRGVPSQQLTAQGYGKSQPIADNDTEEGRAQNRRVEFRVILR